MPGPTEALLAPRLAAATADFGAGLGVGRPGPGRGQLRGHDLVHDRDVGLDAEDGGIERDVAPVCLTGRE